MKYSEIEAVKKSVCVYKEKVQEVLEGKIELPTIKSLMGGMGVYQQRTKGTFMLRVRIPAGVLKLEWLKSIYKVCKDIEGIRFHLTSREDIQIHGLSLAGTIEVMEALLKEDLVTTGGGGDYPRNIACSPLSGVEQDEVFDVTPYALGCCEYIMSIIDTFHLPRKYKIAFSNSPSDVVNASATDLGFIAQNREGEKSFKVYVGGGLGKNPKTGIVFKEKVFEDEILYIVKGLKMLFEAEGDYKNRGTARIRYIVERLGEEPFKALLQQYIDHIKENETLKLNLNLQTHDKVGKITTYRHKRLIKQKQEGLYAVHIKPFGGYLKLEELHIMIQLVEKYKGAQLRLTMNQSLYVTDLNGDEAEAVLLTTAGLENVSILDQIVACTGADTCQIGLAPSEQLINLIKTHFASIEAAKYSALPTIHISGCQSSCTAHQLETIGLMGGKKRVNNEARNIYTLFINGAKGHGKTQLGEEVGSLLMEDVPHFLEKLGEDLTAGTIRLDKALLLSRYRTLFI